MAKPIKRNIDVAIAFGIALCLLVVAVLGVYQKIDTAPAYAAEATDTVIVYATVESWISIAISVEQATMTPVLVDTSGNTAVGSTSEITVNVGTNDAAGFTTSINGDNAGLLSDSNLIATVSPTSTLTDASDNDGYGANASSTDTKTTINANYDYWATTTVGQIQTSWNDMFSTDTVVAMTTTTMKVYAECDSAQPAGTYSDTIYLTATGNTP